MNNHVLSEIKQTKKGRYALFFDDQFYFSVDEEVLVRHHLKVGTAFSDLDIENLKKESDYNKAKEKAFRLLSIRDHSEKELYDKLIKDYDEHTSAAIVSKFCELGLLDDDEFARIYFEQLINKGKSLKEVRFKLLQKGISRERIEELISSSSVNEEERVRELIETKYSSKLSRENGEKTVYDSLVRRGFSPSVIRSVLEEVYEE